MEFAEPADAVWGTMLLEQKQYVRCPF
jgi:hypothetical protein